MISDPQKKRLLIIEDEEVIRQLILSTLVNMNYLVRCESTGQSGIQAAIEFRPDIILLDLGLPDVDGQKVLLKLREWLKCPILILTARDTDEEKVAALDHGADDYLTKPFSVAELLARIRVGLRHAESVGTHAETVFKRKSLEVFLEKRVVKVDGFEIKLSATEYDILKVLIKNSGKVVTHRSLLKEIWGPNSVEHTQYLRVYVGQLRKKLKSKDAVDLITTELGVGYRLIED